MHIITKFLLTVLAILVQLISYSQLYKIGTLDIYGNRKTPVNIIAAALPVKEGDSISHENFNVDAIAEKLKQLAGVKYATVNPVCCDTANNLMLYIGIGETDESMLRLRDAPTQNIMLPAEMMDAYNRFNAAIEKSIMNSQAGENDSMGYAWNDYKPMRDEQAKFIVYADSKLSLLENVLKNSGDAENRAAAAQMIAYSKDRQNVVDTLLFATKDADDGVRNNATRALGILAGFANTHPALNIRIPAEPFVKMINSIVWTDRNKGAGVLIQLCKGRNARLLAEVRARALPSIIEMARWKDRSHASFSFFILGYLAGIDDKELVATYNAKDWPLEVDKMVKIIGG